MEPPRLDWRTKGLPPRAEGLTGGEVGRLGLNLLSGDLMLPAAILRGEALRRNIAEMQAFADRQGTLLCPHGKTTMSPELFQMQLEAGAWGLTAATAHHVRIYRRLGVGRVLLANQLVAKADIGFILGEIAADPTFDFYCLADSAEGIDRLAEAARRAECPRPVQILVETGLASGRAGARSVEAALSLAKRIKEAEPWLALRGIEAFEGIRLREGEGRLAAENIVGLAVAAAKEIARNELCSAEPLLLSAGGSAFLDLCAARLPAEMAGRPLRRVIRPGCYVTHDSGIYERITRADGSPRPGMPDLRHAIEVWGAVLSVPEPKLAIVGIGKRDVSFDAEPPIALWIAEEGQEARPRHAGGMEVVSLWDQHLSLRIAPNALSVGDLVGFGISHPCTTFDRWTALLLVDDSYRVTGAVTTLF